MLDKYRKVRYNKKEIKHSSAFAQNFPKKAIKETERNDMTYAEFLDALELVLYLELEIVENIHRVQVLKNNGVKLDGFSYEINGNKACPTVYVNHYYKESLNEKDLQRIAKQILQIQRGSQVLEESDLLQLLDYEEIKDHIFYRLISKEKNKELLETLPHILWMDLAVVFYFEIPEHMIERASALISFAQLKEWGISMPELYRMASENMDKIWTSLVPMECFLEKFGLSLQHSGIYLLQTGKTNYGAAVILNPNILEQCYETLGEDFYVLPSSVHEVLILPLSMAPEKEEVDKMIQEVNESCVDAEDFLGDHAYRYFSEFGALEL